MIQDSKCGFIEIRILRVSSDTAPITSDLNNNAFNIGRYFLSKTAKFSNLT